MSLYDTATNHNCILWALRVAEKLLPGSKFHRYGRDGHSVVRSSAPYSVHYDIHQHLDFGKHCFFIWDVLIHHLWVLLFICSNTAGLITDFLSIVGGLHRFPPKGQDHSEALSKGKQMQSKAGLHLGVTPAILRARYNLTETDVGTAQNNSQAVAQVWPNYSVDSCWNVQRRSQTNTH